MAHTAKQEVVVVVVTPLQARRGNSIAFLDLVNPLLSGLAWAAFPLVIGWSAERQVDVAVEGLVRRDILL